MSRSQRIEQRVGEAGSRAGERSTIIRRGSEVTVDLTDDSGSVRRFVATLAPGVHERLVEALHRAGFPEAPREIVPPGKTRVVSAIRDGRELRTPPIAQHTSAPHWAEVFALLDAIEAQTSSPESAAAEPVVAGATERALFRASEQLDEPPLGVDANDVVASAWQLATERKHPEVTPAHLLAALARDHGYQLTRLGLDADRILSAAEALFTWDPEPSEPVSSAAFELVPQVARRVAAEDGAFEGTLRHLVRALLEAGGTDVTRVLQQHRLPDAMLAGKTRDRIFAVPAPSIERRCPRCGAEGSELRWCVRCGRALVTPPAFSTGSLLDRVAARVEPHDFAERERAVHRSLCSLPDQSGTPWLVFQLEADGEPELVTPARLAELGLTLERLEQNALANLERSPASWTPRWVAGIDGRELDVLFCIDESRAAERILERPFLLHAQSMLGTNTLAAAIPRRDLLLLTRLEDLAVLMALARKYHDEAESDRISPWGFAIQDGRISGPISA